ncbi:MAG TPA: hypothetical protein VHX65_06995 [Pirellulales bacterium]|jgi:uncharacterized membrane protein|nr:hypothetical protein [Pirellulales bacterium]
MSNWLANPLVHALASKVLLWCTVLALLVVLAVYVLGKFRGSAEEEHLGASELLSKFRELHSQGGLSDEEFRTIKTLLAKKLQRQLKNSGEKG